MPARSTRFAGVARLHHRNEAVAAGERAAFVAELREQGDCFSYG
jgi:hypothetical protein